MKEQLSIKVTGGTLIAETTADPEYPGIVISFQPNSDESRTELALLEEADQKLVLRSWMDLTREDPDSYPCKYDKIIQKLTSAYEITDAEYHDEAGKERAYWDHEVKIADKRYVLVRFYEKTGLIYVVENENGLKVYDYDGRYYQEVFSENRVFCFVKIVLRERKKKSCGKRSLIGKNWVNHKKLEDIVMLVGDIVYNK